MIQPFFLRPQRFGESCSPVTVGELPPDPRQLTAYVVGAGHLMRGTSAGELLGDRPRGVRGDCHEDPRYVEFRIGDSQDEPGLLDSRFRPEGYSPAQIAGAVMHWHVDDVRAAYDRLLSLGARGLAEPRDLEAPGWVIATVADPFGNVIGLMHSPHYLEQLDAR